MSGGAHGALLIEGAGQVATLAGGPRRGSSQADAGLLLDPGAGLGVLIVGDRIEAVGGTPDVSRRATGLGLAPPTLVRIDAAGALLTPGLVDAHTHLVFAGTRERELRKRQAGESYLDILASGGGILSTVERTRAASEDELLVQARGRLRAMLEHGVTTAEAKSGYGLDPVTELRMLSVIRALRDEGQVDLVPTFLGAHAVPRELRGRPEAAEAYVASVVEEQLPLVAQQGIARFCDVFCERGVFDVHQSRRILEAGARLGLRPRLHADEIADSGGAALGADIGAASADHLAAVSEDGIRALATAAERGVPVVATLLPATTLYLMSDDYAPARRLIEAGIPVALGSDLNPGTSPTLSLTLVMSLACLKLRMTPAEALVATTINAAQALGMDDEVGSLEPGRRADVVVWDVPDIEQLPYWLGARLARTVVRAGRVAYDAMSASSGHG
jgi:imidazolonepropionase